MAVTSDSRRIENYCTEVLAWCLIVSPEFLARFVKLCGAPEANYRVHTQKSVKHQPPSLPLAEQFYLDLVLESPQHVLVLEIKAWSGFRTNQLADYEKAVEQEFPKHAPLLVTLTPFASSVALGIRNVSWGQVRMLLRDLPAESHGADHGLIQQFVEFLDQSRLGSMKLDLTSENGKLLVGLAPLLSQLSDIVKALGANREVGRLLGRHRFRPQFEFHEELQRMWIAVDSPTVPGLHVGISFSLPTGAAHLWVCLKLRGPHPDFEKSLPVALAGAFQEATAQLRPFVPTENSGIPFRDGITYFNFARSLPPESAKNTPEILRWFEETVLALKPWVAASPEEDSEA